MQAYQQDLQTVFDKQKKSEVWHYFPLTETLDYPLSEKSLETKIPEIFNNYQHLLVFNNGILQKPINGIEVSTSQSKGSHPFSGLTSKYGKVNQISIKENFEDLCIIHVMDNNDANSSFDIENQVIIHENLQVNLTKVYIHSGEHSSFHNITNDIHILENANVKLNSIHYDTTKGTAIYHNQIQLEKNSNCNHFIFSKGTQRNKQNYANHLKENSSYFVNIMQDGNSNSEQDIYIENKHNTPNATSDILARAIAKDNAKCSLTGKIYVEKNSINTSADFQSKNLLLSNLAEINSRPQLEIYNDSVKCSHGSSIGTLDQDAIFYLQTRGFNEKEAAHILIDAFYHPIFENLDEKTKDLTQKLLER